MPQAPMGARAPSPMSHPQQMNMPPVQPVRHFFFYNFHVISSFTTWYDVLALFYLLKDFLDCCIIGIKMTVDLYIGLFIYYHSYIL